MLVYFYYLTIMNINSILQNIKQKIANFFEKNSNIDDNNKLIFPLHSLYFYRENCSHCKDFTPKFEEQTQNINTECVKFSKIDVNNQDNRELLEKYKIEGTPTVIFLDAHNQEITNLRISGDDVDKLEKDCKKIEELYKIQSDNINANKENN